MSAFSYPLVILLLSLTILVPEALRNGEVVVSHTTAVSPTHRMKEDGTAASGLFKYGCRMQSISPLTAVGLWERRTTP